MSKQENGKEDPSTNRIWPSYLFSGLALLVSCLSFYCNNWFSDLDVLVGKQGRLWVFRDLQTGKLPEPTLFLAIQFTNTGGKSLSVYDSKLEVRWKINGRTVLEREFESRREVQNIAVAELDSLHQDLVAPVAVLGRSAAVGRYVFTPKVSVESKEIPEVFDLEFDLYCKRTFDWKLEGTYIIDSIVGIWQNLDVDSRNFPIVVDIRMLK